MVDQHLMKRIYKEPQSERRHFVLDSSSFTPRCQKKPGSRCHGLLSSPLLQCSHQPRHYYLLLWQILGMSLPAQPLLTYGLVTGDNLLWQLPKACTFLSPMCPPASCSTLPSPPRTGNHQPHSLHSAHLWALYPKLLLTDVWLTQCLTITQKLSVWHSLAQYFITYWGRSDGIDMEGLLFILMERK